METQLAAKAAETATDPSTWFVCILGITVVFLGLIFLICIVSLMNLITEKLCKGSKSRSEAQNTVSGSEKTADSEIENRQEILAAVCAAVAEENGTDISAIRVISFKKI